MKGLIYKAVFSASRLRNAVGSIWSSQAGASAVEYSLLVAFIATVIVAVVGTLGLQLVPGFQAVVAGL
ncbi:Flp family type IVb pilin [Pseudarthrobacter sp. N5]|uniref:Flp family type IVb pilin n=1 Tax=Pseudarthrobacter sp. N5 TaxID=3418416 RepID=UPI003CEBB68E